MKTVHDAGFLAERERFSLVHACEDCVYFDPGEATAARCSHGYPTATHRREAFEPGGASHGMFCKEFEFV